MKLSSISFTMVATLATIAANVIAAPLPGDNHPLRRHSFEAELAYQPIPRHKLSHGRTADEIQNAITATEAALPVTYLASKVVPLDERPYWEGECDMHCERLRLIKLAHELHTQASNSEKKTDGLTSEVMHERRAAEKVAEEAYKSQQRAMEATAAYRRAHEKGQPEHV